MTLKEQMQQYDDEQYAAGDRTEEEARLISEGEKSVSTMDASLFDFSKDDVKSELNVVTVNNSNNITNKPTIMPIITATNTTALLTTIIEEEHRPENIIEEESTNLQPLVAAIFDSTVHTTHITNTNEVIKTPILPTPTSNSYCDNIDNKTLKTEHEGTIVFEKNSLVPTTVPADNPNNIIKDLLSSKNINTVVNLIDKTTLEYVYGMLSEDPCDDDTREVVCGILMEALLS